MTAQPDRDLPPSGFGLPKRDSRGVGLWSPERPRVTLDLTPEPASRLIWLKRHLPHIAVLSLALIAGAGAATLATAPAMTDGVDDIAGLSAIDARSMGLALNIDAAGQQTRQAAIGRDVVTMKKEISRLQRALDQAKSSQASLAKSAAGQVAGAQDEVKALKLELATLQKNFDAARDAAAARIDALASKLDQPNTSVEDAAKLAELRERLERIENRPAPKDAVAAAPAQKPRLVDEPETTGSVAPDAGAVVRNWSVREVYDGLALLEGRQGLLEVGPGAPIPGVGRVRSIERRDRQWVVVTDRGVILQRP